MRLELPLRQQMVYIVGLRRDMTDTTARFAWPGRPRTQTPSDRLLDDDRPVNAAQFAALGMNSKTQMRLHSYLESLRSNGRNPDAQPWIVNIFGHTHMGCWGEALV